MPWMGAMRGPAVLTLLTIAFFVFSAGCKISIDEQSTASGARNRGAPAALSTTLPLYDVAISAVDLDPPLARGAVLSSQQPVKLVAAVENKGAMQLKALTVEASIVSQSGDFTARDSIRLDKLSPGETRVVEFEKVSPPAAQVRSPSYRISVTVDSPQLDPATPRPSRELIVRVSAQ